MKRFLEIVLIVIYCLVFVFYAFGPINRWKSDGHTLRRIPNNALSGKILFPTDKQEGIFTLSISEHDNKEFVTDVVETRIKDYYLTEEIKIIDNMGNIIPMTSYVSDTGILGKKIMNSVGKPNPSRRVPYYDRRIIGYDPGNKYFVRLNELLSDNKQNIRIRCSRLSPDGEMISFICYKENRSIGKNGFIKRQPGQAKLYIFATENKKILAVLDNVYARSKISWSPDSNKVIFSKYDKRLYIYNVKNKVRKFFAEGFSGVWSSDGKEIIFISPDERHVIISNEYGEIHGNIEVNNVVNIAMSPDNNFVLMARIEYYCFGMDRIVNLEVSNRNGSARNVLYEESSPYSILQMHSLYLWDFLIWQTR